MTRSEAIAYLAKLKYWIYDQNFISLAQEYEDAEIRLHCDRFTPEQYKQYAEFVLPSNHEGRARLILNPPFVARGLALLKFLLRCIDGD